VNANYDIRLVAAVGENGQIGLEGKIPWDLPQDREYFRNITKGCVVIFGYQTWKGFSERFQLEMANSYGRTVTLMPQKTVEGGLDHHMTRMLEQYRNRTIIIGGGAVTYKRWTAYCSIHEIVYKQVITRVPYTGPADAWWR
jgi:dihydrofolate reductase